MADALGTIASRGPHGAGCRGLISGRINTINVNIRRDEFRVSVQGEEVTFRPCYCGGMPSTVYLFHIVHPVPPFGSW